MKRNNVFFCVAFTAFLLAAGPVRAEEGRPISRYEEVSFGRPEHSSGSRQKNYGKIEREYRFPRSNFSRYFHPHKPKDEVDFRYDIFDRKYDSLDRNDGNDRAYETRYVKLPNLERTNVTEGPPRPENTLERYKNLPTSAEFVTSKNHHRKANGSDQNAKTFGDFQGGIFTKINTVIRDQFKKIFKPKEPPQAENTPPPFDSPETPGAERKFSKFSKNHTRYGMIEKVQEKKNKRFLNIFTILQFENSRCQAQGSFLSYEGTCYHRNECAALGGFSMGACAKGYGVCCVFRGTCGGVTNQNTTYFECDNCAGAATTTTTASPGTTSTTTPRPQIDPRLNLTALIEMYHGRQAVAPAASSCVFTVQKQDPNVKQIRIDFLDFDIRGPTNGTCLQDQLVVTGQNTNDIIPIICGYNTGQHLYADVSDVSGPLLISVNLMATTPRRFRIRVSQIRSPCANFMNCLQYYTGAEGTLMSFNYDVSPTGLSTPQYYNNLNYAICIRKEPGYCSITYTNVQNNVEAVFDVRNVDSRGTLLVPPNQAGAEIFNCPDDYVIINGIRLCGGKLNDGMTIEDFTRNAPVTDRSAGPIVFPFRTNNNTVGRGFKLYYRQNACP